MLTINDLAPGIDLINLLGLAIGAAFGCVIMVADDQRPTPEMLRAGFKANDRGAGFAWRDTLKPTKGKGDSTPIVRWKKAITDIDEAVEVAAKTPLPYIVHFRIPSVGGPNPDLTHPFPVNKAVNLDHEGYTTGQVLFHNGTWREWDHEMFKAALLRGVKLPRGPFSDSRMMAWIYHLLGEGFLDYINEKVIVFGPSGDPDIYGSGWTCVNNIWCSNDYFRRYINDYTRRQEPPTKKPITPVVMGPRVNSQAVSGGDRRPAGFRPGPSLVANTGSAGAESHLQRPVQGRAGQAPARTASGIVAIARRIGEVNTARHPLTADEEFQDEYRKLVGHPLIEGNPKKFRSSGRAGADALDKARDNAAKGITPVLC